MTQPLRRSLGFCSLASSAWPSSALSRCLSGYSEPDQGVVRPEADQTGHAQDAAFLRGSALPDAIATTEIGLGATAASW